MEHAFQGCYTALVTPFCGDEARSIDFEALQRLVEFQVAGGVSGILAVGTTGESPTLNWEEHSEVIISMHQFAAGRCTIIGGTGSNCTAESIASTHHVASEGIEAVLLVEPYYNGPSSIEIRREYLEPIAREFPDVQVIPYVIPGRSGTQLLPEDLALLSDACPNVNAVKEATGDLENMRRTRACCGPGFGILSGDDGMTPTMMTDPEVAACGVVSVVSNVAPAAVQQMAEALLNGDRAEGERLAKALEPLFDLVTVKTTENSPHGPRLCKARNPLPIKTLMRLLGMPCGGVRQPLGRMTSQGLETVVATALRVWRDNPEILKPVAQAFDVDIERRLHEPEFRRGLAYEPQEA
ncbi:MAG: 4-hydroxy-tetrahydrodipicolinate synthase [Candidatus Brocadiia bacterium]